MFRTCLIAACAVLTLGSAGCVYRVDVQQGNLLELDDIARIRPGMTRSQVRFLLGTPVVDDSFHEDRWDYVYFFREGRSRKPERRWFIVWFDGERVRAVEEEDPASRG